MEFEKIEQRDFSGGVNWVNDPANLGPTELADARNIRVLGKDILSQRLGFTEYNSTAIGASTEIRSLFQFESQDGTFIPVCQASGSKIYTTTVPFPGTTTTWTQAFAETAGASPAIFDAQWGKMVACNNIDGPLVWEGPYGKIAGCKRSIDSLATYQDWYSQAADKDTTTHVPLDAQPAVATGCLLLKSYVPKLTGFRYVVDTTNKNGNSAVQAVDYWNGSAWAAVTGTTDGTIAPAGKTLGQTGDRTFTEATTTAQSIDGDYGFWWRVSLDAALSATVDVISIQTIYNMQPMVNVWDGGYFPPAGFKTTADTSVTFKDWTEKVSDGSLFTVALLGALTVTTGAAYLQSAKKFRGFRVTMSTTNINTNAVTMTAKYWDGDSWEALTIVDGSSANSKTLAQGGDVTFAWPAGFVKRRLAVDELAPTYQVQLLFGAALSANVDVAEIELLELPETLRPHKLCVFHKNRLFLANRADTPSFLYYSAEFGPEVFNGPDSGYIGIPSGHSIVAIERFFNELAIFTPDEIYLLEGSSPETFGLLKINTGGVGCTAPKSCVAVGKFIYFFHSTGFYRFDGIGVTNLSVDRVRPFFDDTQTSYFIPTSRYDAVQGRFDRVHNTVEWTLSAGSAQTTNNMVAIFDVNAEAWYIDDIVAASLLKTISSSYQDLWYHGGYTGKVYRDQNGTSDNGTAISSYVTSRGFTGSEPGTKITFRGVKLMLDTQTSGTVTLSYAMSGNSSFTTLSTPSLVQSGTSHIWRDSYNPGVGTCVQIKIVQNTLNGTFTLYSILPMIEKAREVAPTP